MEPQTIQFVGAPCGQHGPYTFYKAFRFTKEAKCRILSLGEFFFVKISEDAPICVGELQLLWEDKNNDCPFMSSVRLYFLPEHTPEGRQEYHGEDEILAENDKIVLRLEDLCQWIIEGIDWPIGAYAPCEKDIKTEVKDDAGHAELVKVFAANNYGLQLNDVKKEKMMCQDKSTETSVTILSYSRYCRYKAIMKRLENLDDSWLKNLVVSAIGGFTVQNPGTRIVFCRSTFEHPELQSHDFRQDHLAPNLKGRPRKKRLKARKDADSDSNDSDFTPGKEDRATPHLPKPGYIDLKVRRKVLRPNKDHVSEEEEGFIEKLMRFMKTRKTPIDRIPSLGFKQIDLYNFYSSAQKLGGYDQITQRRMWKHLYDKLGGNPGSTSAATCTRRHYERLLLAFERHQKGETDKPLPALANMRQRKSKASERDDLSESDEVQKLSDTEKNDKTNHLSPRIRQTVRTELVQRHLSKDQAGKVAPGQAHLVSAEQKHILVEQSPNHIAPHGAVTAKRADAKENGILKRDAEVSSNLSAQDFAHMQRVEHTPNMVVMVTRDGELVRNRGPSIMTPMMRKNNQHKGNQPVNLPPNLLPHGHRPLYPGRHHLQHPNQNVVVMGPTRGTVIGAGATASSPAMVRQGVHHHMPSSDKHGCVDPRRPSVIQHTQSNNEPKPVSQHTRPQPGTNPHQAIYGPPHLPPQAHGLNSGIKTRFPFHGSLTPTQYNQQGPPQPPTAHSSHGTPAVYIRDLDPYAGNLKRLPIHSSQRDVPISTGLAHRTMVPLNMKQRDDMPTDLSVRRGTNSPVYGSGIQNSGYSAVDSAAGPQQEDGPLNLVTHKRSREESSSSIKPECSEPKKSYIISHSPTSLCVNQSKVNAELSRVSPMQRVSPLPIRALQDSSCGSSPRPSPGPSPRPPSVHLASHNNTPCPVSRPIPQGAKPMVASPDYGAASIHPAFPQFPPHMLPGMLPPNISPKLVYEARLRASQGGPLPGPPEGILIRPGIPLVSLGQVRPEQPRTK